MYRPDVLLLDADGVLQRPARRLLDGLDDDERSAALDALGSVEAGPMVGLGQLRPALAAALHDLGLDEHVEHLLGDWYDIRPDAAAWSLVDEVRADGVRCVLASNQDRERARTMSELLGYADRLDGEVYSCSVRAAKPDAEFFRVLLEVAAVAPVLTLFVDDHAENVDAARALGIPSLLADTDDPSNWIAEVRRRVRLDETLGNLPPG